jgi:hypothetical protein
MAIDPSAATTMRRRVFGPLRRTPLHARPTKESWNMAAHWDEVPAPCQNLQLVGEEALFS